MVIALATAIAASDDESGGFPAPTLHDFFPEEIFFAGTPFAMTRISLLMLLMTGVLSLLVVWAFAKPRLIPTGLQNVAEWAITGMDKAITGEVLGKKGRPFAPYLMAMFFLILFLNSTGILPPMHIPVTSVIGVPIVFAAVTYAVFNVVGIRKHGFGRYLKANVAPPGIPGPLYVLVIPIEFVSTFLLRPFTLAIRLMANMMAGHLLLVLFYSATSYFLLEASGALKAMSVVSYAAGFAFTLFEILVIFLQAYIFTLLTAVYIDGALSSEH
jgi:F-type H+-transporting ATPase subunit a